MLNRLSVAGITIALLLTPLVSSAQSVSDVQTQIQQLLVQVRELQAQLLRLREAQATSTTATLPPLGTRHRICLALRTLQEGDSNEEVQSLQEFLRSEGLLDANVTGFFGPLTREALRRWQANQGIASSGDGATTGWGVFGPRTRTIVARWCAGQMLIPGNSDGNSGTSGGAAGVVTDIFRSIGATSTVPGNRPPVINDFDGPTSVNLNQAGTWTVSASDPDGNQLSYHVTWGDQGSALDALLALADLAQFASSSTFTHAYSRSGIYAVTVRVKDNAGGVAGATRLVQVKNPSSGSGSSFLDQFDSNVDDENSDADENSTATSGQCGAHQIVADNGQCVPSEGTADGSCWFNYQLVANGSWVAAYEEQFVAGPSLNKPCKMQIRTCQSGKLTGTYKYPTCTASTLQNGG